MNESRIEGALLFTRLKVVAQEAGLRDPELEAMLRLRPGAWSGLCERGSLTGLSVRQERRVRLCDELLRHLDRQRPADLAAAEWLRQPRRELGGDSALAWIRIEEAALHAVVRALRAEARP